MNASTESIATFTSIASLGEFAGTSDRGPAVAELFQRHRGMVFRVCLRLLRNHHDAEDVTQETFRRATSSLHRWDSNRPIEPWLVSIAGNRCRTLLSKRNRETCVDSLDEAGPWSLADQEPGVAALCSMKEQVELALETLPDNYRHAFELVHRHDLTYTEAAEELGRSEGTIKTWVHRARMSMQDSLERRDAVAAGRASTAGVGDEAVRDTVVSGERVVAAAQRSSRWPSVARRMAATSVASILSLACWLTTSPTSTSPSESLSDASAQLQVQSLQAFSRQEWSVAQIEQLPIGTWMGHTVGVVDQLQEGVAPLGRTFRNVALLFTCTSDTDDATLPGPSSNELLIPFDEVPSTMPGVLDGLASSEVQSLS